MVTALLVIQVCVKSHFIQKGVEVQQRKKKIGNFYNFDTFFPGPWKRINSFENWSTNGFEEVAKKRDSPN